MSAAVLICGKVFDGSSDVLTGPAEISSSKIVSRKSGDRCVGPLTHLRSTFRTEQ